MPAPHGSEVFELGDTYSGSGGGGGDYLEGGLREGQPGFGGSAERESRGNAAHWRKKNEWKKHEGEIGWPLDKSLTGIPTLFTWSLAYGRNLLRPEHTISPWRYPQPHRVVPTESPRRSSRGQEVPAPCRAT